MLNFFGNNTLVPNGYVYTSHTGSKYVFLEGLWFKNSSMGMVDPKSYNNMYVCAQKQINEHNSKSKIKIGETYLREGKNQIFIGEGRYTIDGLLVESQFSDFKKADPNKIEIPNRFKEGDYTYNKKEKAWYDRGEKVTDLQFAKELNTDAIKRINQYNSSDEFPVNSTVTYDGKKLTWNGTNWTDDYGTSYGDKFAAKVDEYIQDNPESSSNDSSTDPVQQDGEQTNSSEKTNSTDLSTQKMPKGTSFTSKSGIKYVYDGNGNFVSDKGKVYPPALTDQILAKYNAEQAQKEQESKKPEDEKIKNDIDSRVDDTSTADPEDKHEEEKADQEKAIDDNDAKVDDVEENDKIKSLADRIKANPKSRNIEVLLTRADKLSLMAADILLSGKADEVKKILQSLNSRDE